MQSLRLLIATAVLAIAAAQPDRSSVWDAFARDKTQECKDMIEFVPTEKKCDFFSKCCTHDPLNGDKCKNQVKTCEQNDEDGSFHLVCTYSNCTEMITTTTTTTTQSPRQVNGAPVASLFLLISALLPHFLF